MKRWVLALAATAGLAILGAAGAGLWLHWYMGQPVFIEEIRLALARATGAEVDLERLVVRGVQGVELRGVEVVPAQGGRLKAGTVRLTFSVVALAMGRLEIYQVGVDGAELVVKPTREGEWPSFLAGVVPEVRIAGRGFPVSLNLTQLQLDRSRVEVQGADGELMAVAEGVEAEAGLSFLPGWTDASGVFRASSLRLGSGLRLTNVTVPVRLGNRVVTMAGMKAFCHGGSLEGTLTGNFARTVPTFSAEVAVREVDLGVLLEEGGARTRWAEGTLALDAKVEGTWRQVLLATGVGRLTVDGAGISTLDVLGTLGQALGLSELRAPRFERVTGDFKIADRRLTFYNLEGVSPMIELSGAGYVNFDGQMDLDMLLGLHPEIGDRIPAHVLGQFNQRSDQFRLITFKLWGPISNPTSNLQRKLFAGSGTVGRELASAR
ncbi:MAG: AsmA-like C-terminal region-containing protein [Verrucomicrobiia bacterium]